MSPRVRIDSRTRISLLTSLLIVLVASTAALGQSNPQPPNIVILLADDLGWADVGYHGGPIDTPNIDSLAMEGVALENFHVAPLCSPTRAGLMTGRWPIRYGMAESVITPWRKWGLDTRERTVAQMLAAANYQARAAIGKWHLGHYERRFLPLNRGFNEFYGHYNGAFDYFTHEREGELDWHRDWDTSQDSGYSTDLIGLEAVRFIRSNAKREPFFLYVPFNAPHTPLQAKKSDIKKYASTKDVGKRTFYAMVDSMDQAIGKILAELNHQSIADDTFVLFFSDNGGVTQYSDNGPWRAGKGTVYEGGMRTPAVVRWPNGFSGGRRIDELMGYIDIYPTLKRISGSSDAEPQPLDGKDMFDVIRGNKASIQRDWFSYIAQSNPERTAITRGEWKLVVTKGNVLEASLDEDVPKIELFNLERDPGEQTDLSASEPELTRNLLRSLQDHRRLKIDGIPNFLDGKQGFEPPKDWLILD